jgi:O-antigen/teichoic acid export membrane protein
MALDWLGPTASAQMAIAMRVCLTATGILSVLVLPFWPGFADAIATKDRRWQWQTLRNGTLANLGLSIMGSTMLIAFGGSLLHWWLHQNLTISPTLLWVMAAWITLTTLTNIPSLLLHAALWLRPQILTISIPAAVSFILKYFAAKAFGVARLLSVTPLLWLFFVIPIYFYLSWRWTSPTLDA